jgi:hypothetical protein
MVPVTLQGLSTELVLFWNLKKSIEKYVEKKLHIKIKNKWKEIK